MKWINRLKMWRKARGITVPSGKIVTMLEEEIAEYSHARTIQDEHEMIDALADIIVLASNELALMGYDTDLVLKQTVKHISSRVQDPAQAALWKSGQVSEKWKKYADQNPDSIYLPNYSSCKLKRSILEHS